jgi:hypothetical protein
MSLPNWFVSRGRAMRLEPRGIKGHPETNAQRYGRQSLECGIHSHAVQARSSIIGAVLAESLHRRSQTAHRSGG